MTSNAGRALEAVPCDALLATDPATVTWLSGFAQEVIYGPNVFAAPPLAVVRDGTVTLVVTEDEEPAALETGCEVLTFEGFTVAPLDPFARQAAVVAGLGLRGRVAVERHALPLLLADAVGAELVDAAAQLRPLRAVKSATEIERIRAAIHLCDVGQAAARRVLQPGLTELEAWHAVAAAIEGEAAERLPILADLVSGERTAGIGGPPADRRLAEGDLVIVDLVPRLAGWWGDSCATIAVGEPADVWRSAHARARETLDSLVEAVRPGVVAGDLDRLGRDAGLDYPHHTGHGLGTTNHEGPRIVPGNEVVLEPGMLVALEPGTYPGPQGLRVERIVLVTEGGCEVLSGHDLSL